MNELNCNGGGELLNEQPTNDRHHDAPTTNSPVLQCKTTQRKCDHQSSPIYNGIEHDSIAIESSTAPTDQQHQSPTPNLPPITTTTETGVCHAQNQPDNFQRHHTYNLVPDNNDDACELQSTFQLDGLAIESNGTFIDNTAGTYNHNKNDNKSEQQKQTPDNIVKQKVLLRKFQVLDPSALSSSPAPDVKIGQRVAYKEYYGNEFGTIRWIGRVPQISPDWTVGVEFDNAIGEGDGSLNGRRYFIAKDCFAKFLSLNDVALVDQHVGRPEPGTMISVMSATVRPGQMISIQRVSTVHVQHCFLNAPHQQPIGADILAVNTRLHCQCPNCGPCAHVVKPPRTQRLRTGKNATHMCQFSTYTCCGMQSQEETLCTYTGNKISSSSPPPPLLGNSPPFYNSWIQGSGYLTNLQAQQSKLMPEEYRLGAAPEDRPLSSRTSSRRGSGRHNNQNHQDQAKNEPNERSIQVEKNDCDATHCLGNCVSTSSMRHHRKHNHSHHHHHSGKKSSRHRSRSRSPIYSNLQEETYEHRESAACCRDAVFVQQQQQQPTKNLISAINPTNDRNKHEQPTSDTCPIQENGPPSYKVAISSENHGNIHTGHGKSYTTTMKNVSGPVGSSSAYVTRDVNENESSQSIAAVDISHNGQQRNDQHEEVAKSAKVVYRDSIENRYLFPTDDIIDTTLEADLEDLSQARYGRLAHNGDRSNGTTSASTKNILRGLRSLVSCLSGTRSNQSNMSENRSGNTLKFYERTTNGLANNKSLPMLMPTSAGVGQIGFSGSHCHRDGGESCSTIQEEASYEFARACNYNNTTTTKPMIRPYEQSVSPLRDYRSASGFCSTSSPSSAVHSENFKFDFKDQLHHQHGRSSWGTASGIDGGANGRGDTSERQTTGTYTTTTIKQVRRQMSSSSDCGFSSASQNSVNFQSYPNCSPIEDEQKRINQIYKRIVARLLSSAQTSSAITNEDLLRLKKTLFEIHSENCCLHSDDQVSNHHHHQHKCRTLVPPSIETDVYDQIIADVIKNYYLNVNPEATTYSTLATNGGVHGIQNNCTDQQQQFSSQADHQQPGHASWSCVNDYATKRSQECNQQHVDNGTQPAANNERTTTTTPTSSKEGALLLASKIMSSEQCPDSLAGCQASAGTPMNHGTHNDSSERQPIGQTLSRSSDSQSLRLTDQANGSLALESTATLVKGPAPSYSSEKCDSVSSLLKTFELKLTLSISADDERLKACNLNEINDVSGHANGSESPTNIHSARKNEVNIGH